MVNTVLTTSRSALANAGQTVIGSTQYQYLGNAPSTALTTSELSRNIRYRTAGTISGLYVRAVSNSTSADSTITVRKNSVDTALTVTIPAGTNGNFTDLTHVVSLVPGDTLSYKSVSGGASGNYRFAIASVIFNSSSGNAVIKTVTQGFNLATASTTNFLSISGYQQTLATVETEAEQTMKKAGTAKNAFIYVSANARTTNTTFTLRKNQVDTAIAITYVGGEGGIKEDTTHPISFTVDDKLDWKVTTDTGTQTITPQTIAIELETSTNNGYIGAGATGTGGDLTIAPNVTSYHTPSGGLIENISEADSQITARAAFSLSNLSIFVKANTLTSNTTIRLRKNGANANQLITVAGGQVGFINDTTNTDTFTAGDTMAIQITTGGTGTQITIGQLALWSLDTEAPVVGAGVAGSFRAQGRSPLYRAIKPKAVAVIIRLKVQLQYQVTKLTIRVGIAYINQRPKPAIKYASAIIRPVLNILPLRQRPTPKHITRTITTQIPYEVQTIQLKSACAYQVDKLITRKQQTKLRTIATNFLFSDV